MTTAPLTRDPSGPDTAVPDTAGEDRAEPDPAAPGSAAPGSADPGETPSIPASRRPRVRAPGYEPDPVSSPPAARAYGAGADVRTPATTGWNVRPAAGRHSRDDAPGATPAEGSRPAGPGTAGPHPPADARHDRPGRHATPDPLQARATVLVRAVLEVLCGRRPPAQLAGAAAPSVLRYLAATRPDTARTRTARSGRVHVRRPHADAAEVVAVCRIGDRVRALALRLDREPGIGGAHGDDPVVSRPVASGPGGTGPVASGPVTSGPVTSGPGGTGPGHAGRGGAGGWVCTAARLL